MKIFTVSSKLGIVFLVLSCTYLFIFRYLVNFSKWMVMNPHFSETYISRYVFNIVKQSAHFINVESTTSILLYS